MRPVDTFSSSWSPRAPSPAGGIGDLVVEATGEIQYTGVDGQAEDGALATDELLQRFE